MNKIIHFSRAFNDKTFVNFDELIFLVESNDDPLYGTGDNKEWVVMGYNLKEKCSASLDGIIIHGKDVHFSSENSCCICTDVLDKSEETLSKYNIDKNAAYAIEDYKNNALIILSSGADTPDTWHVLFDMDVNSDWHSNENTWRFTNAAFKTSIAFHSYYEDEERREAALYDSIGA